MTTLNRLLNADNECVGYFTDDDAGRAAMQAARAEWDAATAQEELRRFEEEGDEGIDLGRCRSLATSIKPLELEDVEPGDGDQVDSDSFCEDAVYFLGESVGLRVEAWYRHGATDVNTQRHEINRYRRPGKSNRSADLGGPEQAAGVLYVLTIKASK